MKTLVVIAHPLPDSLCHALAQVAIKSLTAAGHEVVIENLYDEDFSPVLTKAERQSYCRLPFDASAIAGQFAPCCQCLLSVSKRSAFWCHGLSLVSFKSVSQY